MFNSRKADDAMAANACDNYDTSNLMNDLYLSSKADISWTEIPGLQSTVQSNSKRKNSKLEYWVIWLLNFWTGNLKRTQHRK